MWRRAFLRRSVQLVSCSQDGGCVVFGCGWTVDLDWICQCVCGRAHSAWRRYFLMGVLKIKYPYEQLHFLVVAIVLKWGSDHCHVDPNEFQRI